jgi:murein DD-endopeptidase MepM/ murein hydrolase activator NlpD
MQQPLNTILLTTPYGRVRSFRFNPRSTALFALLFVTALCSAIYYSGLRIGIKVELHRQFTEVADLQSESQQQQTLITNARDAAQASLDALTLRIGQMQAQMLRLDVLAERLVQQTDLDAGEFDFDGLPSVGGPGDASGLASTGLPDFLGLLDEMDLTVQDREYKLTALEQLLTARSLHARVIPSGEVVERGLLSSKFGKRIDPFTGKLGLHKGIDIAGKEGADVMAVGDGVVTRSGEHTGYGNLVEINHGNGYVTRYGHNQELLVAVSDTVRKGQAIALIGSTGRSTGPHVHIEVVHNGKQVNPSRYLNN